GIGRLVGYQDAITVDYQRKSLELQLRHYYVARDSLEVTRTSISAFEKKLDAIVKNTALPDYQKIQLSESYGQMVRDSILGRAHDTVEAYTRNFFSKTMENLQGWVTDKVDGLNEVFEMLDNTVEMAADAMEM